VVRQGDGEVASEILGGGDHVLHVARAFVPGVGGGKSPFQPVSGTYE
jgi:hypothetical protein